MKMALGLAAKGEGFTSPNPMVGAVVVKDGEVVGKGYHEAAGQAHAEVNAIDDAGKLAREATIYVTLEPCNHTGQTPPCTEKILAAGINRVVVAMDDPNPDVKGGGNAYLREKGVEVVTGICEHEAKKLNQVFIKHIRTRRPFVLLKCAATLDGRIATRTGDSKWVSCEESRKHAHRLRHALDGIMVGIGTVKNDNPSLTTRLGDMQGRDPMRIILDTHLSIPEDAKVLHHINSDADTIIISGDAVPQDKKIRMEKAGVKLIQSRLENGAIALDPLMDQLGEMGITGILLEGGARVIASALKAGIVDKINLIYAPKILGADDGVPICRGAGPELMRDSLKVRDMQALRLGEDVMIDGYL